MSLRFRCPKCGQKLRIGDGKVGQLAKCPRCQTSVPIPAASPERDSTPTALNLERLAGDVPAPLDKLPVIQVHDDEVEWVYEADALPEEREPEVVDDTIAVSRRVVYTQGILLGVLPLAAFILGLVLGSASSRDPDSAKGRTPCSLTGRITYRMAGRTHADQGSAVIVLPADRHPAAEERVPFDGLRPGDPEPLADHPSLQNIRRLGGDCTRADSDGLFQLDVADAGVYHLLVVSAHARMTDHETHDRAVVAQIGRYFHGPLDLVSDYRYHWTKIAVHRDLRLDDIEF
jgi:hypothetical protein